MSMWIYLGIQISRCHAWIGLQVSEVAEDSSIYREWTRDNGWKEEEEVEEEEDGDDDGDGDGDD
jgi:hypothetical protein